MQRKQPMIKKINQYENYTSRCQAIYTKKSRMVMERASFCKVSYNWDGHEDMFMSYLKWDRSTYCEPQGVQLNTAHSKVKGIMHKQ